MDTETETPTDDGHGMSDFERLLATASMLEASITIHLRGPRTPRPLAPAPGEPRWVALVQLEGTRKVLGFGETPSEAIESASSGQVISGPYAVKS